MIRFDLVWMRQLSAMVSEEVERPSHFKVTTNNLASSLMQSNTLKKRSLKIEASGKWHAGWWRSTCKSCETSFGNQVIRLNPCGSKTMVLSKELLCWPQKMPKNLEKLSNWESAIDKWATPTPTIIQVVPIYFFRYKQWTEIVIMEDSHASTWQEQRQISKQGLIWKQKTKLYLSIKVFNM